MSEVLTFLSHAAVFCWGCYFRELAGERRTKNVTQAVATISAFAWLVACVAQLIF